MTFRVFLLEGRIG